MFRCPPIPCSYLLLITVILATSGRGACLCRHDQNAALLHLKASFRLEDTGLSLSSWKVQTNCCTWKGVTCDDTIGNVTALDLSYLGLSGNLSSSDIFKLTSLRYLSLAGNDFDETPWPNPGFEQLKDLNYLDLSYSGLSGDLPVENRQLSNLVTLNLSGLHLKDLSLETLIDSLGNLQQLELYDINISASRTHLAHASSTNNRTSRLKELRMSTISGGHFDTVFTNLLFGSKLANLVMLDLYGYDLKILSLLALIDSLGSLQKLYLENVNISISLPTDLAHASSTNMTSGLKELTMTQCMIIGGHFYTVFTNLRFLPMLSNLVTLDLSGFGLKNLSLHALINSLGSLQNLYLENVNILISSTDLARASSTNTKSGLKELTMWWCTITGGHFNTVLTKLPYLSNLVTLDISGVDLKNLSLDALIDNLGSLQKLYLDLVKFSVGPSDLAHPTSTNMTSGLKSLRINWCTITGGRLTTVLTRLPFLSNLVILELSGLDLKNLSLYALIDNLGSLQKLYFYSLNILVSPTDLALASSSNMTSRLVELSITNCMVTGRIDIALTKFPFLSKLTLDGTKIHGPTPVLEHSAEFSSLVVLSLSTCALTGTFPSWIFRIKSLTSLDVRGNKNLCGELPEFLEGSALQELVLGSTKFSGKIPESIGNLQNLTWLDLSNCQFHGPIPSFSQWPMISMVDLSGNILTGSLPSDGYLSLDNLTEVILRNNSISGVIPASLFSHPCLEYLDLAQNNFTGNFVLYPNISSSLRRIDVSFNKLQGSLPELMSEFVELVMLDLSSNNLTGTVDLSFIKNYKYLQYLSLSDNKLSVVEVEGNHSYAEYPIIQELGLASCNLSYVPKFLMHQIYMYNLDLSNNNISGYIPDWIWGIGEYLSLNLSHNLLTNVSTNLLNTSILYLDISSNKIEGALPLPPSGIHRLDYSNNNFNSSVMPEFWSRVSSAMVLSLANNSLTGDVSHLICNATDIRVIDLSSNTFSGLIPPCLLKHNKHLEILNLRGNNFHGSLPQDITEDCALQIVNLNGNKLEGKLPVSLINCHKIQVLDLGNNLIVDPYPEWLGVLPLLKVLILKSNGFHGPINITRMNKQMHPFFPKLQVLDLSSNSLNGSIPTRFLKQFKAMMVVSSGAPNVYVGTTVVSSTNDTSYYRELVTVTLKGQETTVQILTVFMSLDLSNNNFEGIIPNEIGDLKFLKQLNLSKNSFTGGIPPQITSMLQLESLDLSFNQLSGKIPPAMAQMSFLEVLNLSYNHLSGLIPQSSQFLTFPNTSFLGNDGLCGKPLTRPCDTNHAPSAAPIPDSSKELNWEFLSVEVGVVSGLAIVVVTTLLWGNGRRWVYLHVDKFWLHVLQPWIYHRRR